MKRILLLCSILILSVNLAIAQMPDKTVFGSEASKFEANSSRNRTDLSQTAYNKLVDMMSQAITANKNAAAKAIGNDKKALDDKIGWQEHYFGEIKALSGDILKNRVAIKAKLDSFHQLL